MLTLGGGLKKRELLSSRLGDVLSSMYLASTVLKHFENQGRRATDLPLVEWSVRTLMYEAQESLHAFLRNFPNRWVAAFLRVFLFPRGRTYSAPSDELSGKVVDLMTRSGEARDRLSRGAYTTLEPGNPLGQLQEALELAEKFAPLERRLKQAQREGLIRSDYLGEQIEEAGDAGVISKKETRELRDYHDKVRSLLAVDDFAPEQLGRSGVAATAVPVPAATGSNATKRAKKKTASRKKTTTGNARSKKNAQQAK
jgi:acyl-CoA dehydrogenase